MLELDQVSFAYPGQAPALNRVSISIKAGEFFGIVGRNGSGKTTLTRVMVGLAKPATGRVWLDGDPVQAGGPAMMARTIGYVFQNPDRQIFRDTVASEVAFGPEQLGWNETEREAAVAAALTQNPEVALASLLATMIVSDLSPWVRSPLNIRITSNEHEIKRLAAGYAESPAAAVLERADALPEGVDIASDSVVARLLAFELPQLLRLLAVYVARSYSVCSDEPATSERIGSGLAREIEAALGLDMADWWAPGAECFLSHVPKAKMVQAVAEACGLQAAAPIAKMKKDAAIAAAAAALEGRRWLPLTLRPYPPGVPAGACEGHEEGQMNGAGR